MIFLEILFSLALIASLYEVLLRKETFFQANRWYLLLMPLLVIIIPFIHIQLDDSKITSVINPIVTHSNNTMVAINQSFTTHNFSKSYTVGDAMCLVFWIGFSITLMRSLVGLNKVFQLIKVSNKQKKGTYTFVLQTGKIPTASFLNYIFCEEDIEHQEYIYNHELVHINQKHTWDLLFMELLVAIQWYNPAIYYIKKRLKEVHEFIADEQVVKISGNPYQYAAVLVSEARRFHTQPSSIINTFSSFTKKRLIMLSKPRSKSWRVSKYLLAFPVFLLLFLLFSCELIAEIIPPTPVVKGYIDDFVNQNIELPITRNNNSELLTSPNAKAIVKTTENKEKYIFYWGTFQIEFVQQPDKPDFYTANIEIPIDKIKDLSLNGRFYFWNGKSLENNFQFTSIKFNNQKQNAVEKHWSTAQLKNIEHFRNDVYGFVENIEVNDQIQINDLYAESLSGKHLLATINITSATNERYSKIVQLDNTNANEQKNKTISLDFKWGNIAMNKVEITKKELLKSVLQQPIVFNEYGQPVQKVQFDLTVVSFSKAYDPVTYPIKSELTNYEVYVNKRAQLPALLDKVKTGDMIYLDNIEGDSPTMGRFKFSLAIKIIE